MADPFVKIIEVGDPNDPDNYLKIEVTAVQVDGDVKFTVTVLDGYANINGLFWQGGDNDGFDGFKTNKKGDITDPVNMNGSGEDWDGGLKLSDPGLGQNPEYDGQSTFLQQGDSLCITIPGMSLENLDNIGIRATSTSTAEGSIKGVGEDPPDEPEKPNHFPDFDNDISHVDFYFDLDGNPDNGAEFIVRVNTKSEVDDDLDNWYEDALDYIKANYVHLADAELLGAAIWGGNLFPDEDPKGKKYFYALDGDPNPDDPITPGIVANNIVDDDPDYGVQGGFGFGGTGINNLVLHYDGNSFQDTPFV